MKKPLILLDRDGVINHDDPQYIRSVTQWLPIAGSLEAIAQLKRAAYSVAIITNQSGIARGLYTEEILQAIHDVLAAQLQNLGCAIDAIFYCPHQPQDHCVCRKPRSGLLHQAAHYFQHDFNEMLVIGDSYRDIQAARSVGAQAYLVTTGRGAAVCKEYPDLSIPIYDNLATAVDSILLGEDIYA